MRSSVLLLTLLFLAGCGSTDQRATLISMKDGKSVYAVSGLVMVPEVTEGITKPYVEQGLSQACPNGVNFRNYREGLNKHVPFGAWVQWEGEAECK